MAVKKLQNFELYQALYPEFDFIFVGDSGQGDVSLGTMLLEKFPDRVREVATLIPGAMRGLVSERQLGSYADLDVARRGLTNALVAYLQPTP